MNLIRRHGFDAMAARNCFHCGFVDVRNDDIHAALLEWGRGIGYDRVTDPAWRERTIKNAEEFIAGEQAKPEPDRRLATVLFVDIVERCGAEKLTVYARYQRRGGIDINPFRSSQDERPANTRLWRQ